MERIPYGTMNPRWVSKEDLGEHVTKLTKELERATAKPGWNPKMVKLDGNTAAIDVCGDSQNGGLHSALVVDYVDDPRIHTLPAGTPRAVKAMFRREVMMRHLRSDEAWGYIADADAADLAWDKFVKDGSQQCS